MPVLVIELQCRALGHGGHLRRDKILRRIGGPVEGEAYVPGVVCGLVQGAGCAIHAILECPCAEAFLKALRQVDPGRRFPVPYLVALAVACPGHRCGVLGRRCDGHIDGYGIAFGYEAYAHPVARLVVGVDTPHLYAVRGVCVQMADRIGTGGAVHRRPGVLFRIDAEVVDEQIVLVCILVTDGDIAFLSFVLLQVDGDLLPLGRGVAGRCQQLERADVVGRRRDIHLVVLVIMAVVAHPEAQRTAQRHLGRDEPVVYGEGCVVPASRHRTVCAAMCLVLLGFLIAVPVAALVAAAVAHHLPSVHAVLEIVEERDLAMAQLIAAYLACPLDGRRCRGRRQIGDHGSRHIQEGGLGNERRRVYVDVALQTGTARDGGAVDLLAIERDRRVGVILVAVLVLDVPGTYQQVAALVDIRLVECDQHCTARAERRELEGALIDLVGLVEGRKLTDRCVVDLFHAHLDLVDCRVWNRGALGVVHDTVDGSAVHAAEVFRGDHILTLGVRRKILNAKRNINVFITPLING